MQNIDQLLLADGLKKSKFVEDLTEGQTFDDIFFVDSVSKKFTKTQKPYWKVTLRDRTGSVTGTVWSNAKFEGEDAAKRGEFVKVRAEVQEAYKGDGVELNIKMIRRLHLDEPIDPGDFVPVGPNDRFKRMIELEERVIEWMFIGPFKSLCLAMIRDPFISPKFRDAPAASGNHHSYVGGLLDHVFSMMDVANALAAHYDHQMRPGEPKLNYDLLITACIFHDIGKIRELTWENALGYSTEGKTVGHVVIGLEILELFKTAYWSGNKINTDDSPREQLDAIEKTKDDWDHLRHLIASHHGNLEWGAAKTPMSREATLFHLIDMIDSRMGNFDIIAKEPRDEDGFTNWVKSMGGAAWFPKS